MTDPLTSRAVTRDYWPTDGWRTSAPGAQGMDADRLAQAREHWLAQTPHLDSLIVARHGTLVSESYRGESGADRLHNVKSVTKSVLSALAGIAIGTGDLAGVDEPLGAILPEAFTSADDPRKRMITVGHLLAMRSGLDWAEYGPSAAQMTASPHWVRYVLDLPLAHEPGQHHNYSTGDTHLLSAALYRAAGLSALDFADLYLFRPLGIARRVWPADPQGITIGGSELALTPRDMAKFGYLYLNGGVWAGEQVIPAAWVAASTARQAVAVPGAAQDCPEIGYGYLWWLRPQGEHPSFLAVGYGGQFITVVPDLDLVVVITGDLHRVSDDFRDNRMLCQYNLVEDFIVPAVTDFTPR